ncbi:MAG: hypothetical protein MUE41_01120 [Gemmatimonadaceae bacterium]|jgi:uncharacterized protein involved in exopolysaccharide biosynthesis|nr:hypothetical protein [Gemmatimonadaceae bacterium]
MSASLASLDDPDVLTLREVTQRLRRGLRVIFLTAALLGGITLVTLLLLPRRYTASASFAPAESRGDANRLSGLAAVAGVSLGAQTTESPGFYGSVLTSSEAMRDAVTAPLAAPAAGAQGTTLVEWFDSPGETTEARVAAAMAELRSRVKVDVQRDIGTVTVSYRDKSPVIAAAVLQRLLRFIDDFNQRRRRTRAKAEREFTGGRLAEARAELRDAELALVRFRTTNRGLAGSAFLQLEQERLQREVVQRQGVLSTLLQAYEQSRVEEVRNTPLITVIETPRVPARPDPRRAALFTVLAGLVGGAIAAARAVLRAS